MSISPKIKEEDVFSPSLVSKTTTATKKLVSEFFVKPTHYLFWMSLTSVIVCLFFGVSISWQLYLIITLLGVNQFYDVYKTNNK